MHTCRLSPLIHFEHNNESRKLLPSNRNDCMGVAGILDITLYFYWSTSQMHSIPTVSYLDQCYAIYNKLFIYLLVTTFVKLCSSLCGFGVV